MEKRVSRHSSQLVIHVALVTDKFYIAVFFRIFVYNSQVITVI